MVYDCKNIESVAFTFAFDLSQKTDPYQAACGDPTGGFLVIRTPRLREKALHDEASALSTARKEGRAEAPPKRLS